MASSIRIFVADPLGPGATIDLGPGQAHYLAHVMRRGAGDPLALFNGRDGEWEARITRLARDRGSAELVRALRPQAPEPDLWLAFAVLKRDATELVVEKATELGVSRLIPVTTGRSVASRINADRLQAIATEAAEQCERLSVPDIAAIRPLHEMLDDWPAGRPLHAAIERLAAGPLADAPGPAALLVGPEGGFTPAELDVLRRCPFIVAASLGPRILRAETAAIAGLARLLAHPAPDPPG